MVWSTVKSLPQRRQPARSPAGSRPRRGRAAGGEQTALPGTLASWRLLGPLSTTGGGRLLATSLCWRRDTGLPEAGPGPGLPGHPARGPPRATLLPLGVLWLRFPGEPTERRRRRRARPGRAHGTGARKRTQHPSPRARTREPRSRLLSAAGKGLAIPEEVGLRRIWS